MKTLVLFIFLITLNTLNAQDYTPIDTANKDFRIKTSEKYLQKNKLFLTQIKNNYDKKLLKYITSNFKELHKEFNTQILEGQTISNTKINKMVSDIILEMQSKNSIVPKDLNFFIMKDGSANAACFGDNTILINLGLFYFLENEDQIASVISHEIGHQILNHAFENILTRYEQEKSDTNKDKLKKLKKLKYKKGEKALQMLKEQLYAQGEMRKKNEYEADSIGYVLYRNSKYNKLEYKHALKILELYDTIKPKGLKQNIYKTMFNLPNQPFNEKWMEMEDFSAYNYSHYKEDIDLDSLSSHPETDKRIKNIENIFIELKENKPIKNAEENYKEVFKIAKYERIPNLYFNEEYGGVVYVSLYYLQKNKDNSFYKKWLGKGFTKIYEARKSYTLNRYLDRISPKDQSESYQQFLSFMWNLKLDELKNIAEYYSN